MQLEPGNADYRIWLAEHEEFAGGSPERPLRDALRLRPVHSAAWIRLGLWEESRGNVRDAESLLLRAAEVDRLHVPRWTLANFYFRQKRQAEFALWLDRAFAMSYGDRRALFDLALRAAPSEDELLRLIPDSVEIRLAFLRHLASLNRTAGAAAIARAAASAATPEQTRELVSWSTRLIDAGDAAGAHALWTLLCGRGVLACPNDSFRADPSGEGFDWRLAHPAVRTAGGLRLRFDGSQPEHAEILWRWVYRPPSVRVRADWDAAPGFTWVVDRSGTDLARLTLRYDRPQGQVRYRGEILIRSARLEP